MDVNKHDRLFNIRLIHTFKYRNSAVIAVLHFTVIVGSTTMCKIHTLKWVWNSPWACSCVMDPWIFVVLMLLGVCNLISKMRCYEQENKTWVKQSYKYRHHFTRHHITKLQIQRKGQSQSSNQVNSMKTR